MFPQQAKHWRVQPSSRRHYDPRMSICSCRGDPHATSEADRDLRTCKFCIPASWQARWAMMQVSGRPCAVAGGDGGGGVWRVSIHNCQRPANVRGQVHDQQRPGNSLRPKTTASDLTPNVQTSSEHHSSRGIHPAPSGCMLPSAACTYLSRGARESLNYGEA